MRKYFYFLMFPIILFSACGKSTEPSAPPPAASIAQRLSSPIVEEKKERPPWVYPGDKFRDPFTPSGVSSSYQSNAVFDPKRTTLKAIIVGSGFNSAVLTQGNGISYFIKSGIIFDVMGKIVQGYTAEVFENKVVLKGEEDNQYEIKLRNTEKGGNSL